MAASNPEGGLRALFGEILSLPIVPPTQRLAELGAPPPWPPTFDAWFLRCVHRDMGQRFASAGEAVAALAVALGVSSPVASASLRLAEHVPAAPSTAQTVTASAMPVWRIRRRLCPNFRRRLESRGARRRVHGQR